MAQAALLYKKSKRLVYGAIPYGYSRYGDALKAIEMEFGVIRQIQDWHARGWSLHKIADALNRRRVRTKNDDDGMLARYGLYLITRSINIHADSLAYLVA